MNVVVENEFLESTGVEIIQQIILSTDHCSLSVHPLPRLLRSIMHRNEDLSTCQFPCGNKFL